MRVLARGHQGVLAGRRVEIADRGARLHGVGDQPVVDDVDRCDMRGLLERGIDLRPVADLPVVAQVVRDIVVHRRTTGERRLHVDDRRQFLVRDVYAFGRGAGLVPGFGDDDRDLVADMPDFVEGDDRVHGLRHRRTVLVVDLPTAGKAADSGVLHVLSGEHGDHAIRPGGL